MTEVFRKQYRELSPEQRRQIDDLKDQAQGLLDTIREITVPGPEVTIAQRKLEECVMWAVKAVTG